MSKSTTITRFEDTSYIEEGEFRENELNETFGRKIFINGSYKLGWFKGGGDQLHGFGSEHTFTSLDSEKGSIEIKGLFVAGIPQHEQILAYDKENDLIAQDFYSISKNVNPLCISQENRKAIIDKLKDMKDNLKSKMDSSRQDAAQLFQDDSSEEMTKLCEVF